MPEGDENPFLQPQPGAGAGGPDPAELMGMLQDIGDQMGHMPPGFEDVAQRIQDMGPEEAAEFQRQMLAAMEAHARGEFPGGGGGNVDGVGDRQGAVYSHHHNYAP